MSHRKTVLTLPMGIQRQLTINQAKLTDVMHLMKMKRQCLKACINCLVYIKCERAGSFAFYCVAIPIDDSSEETVTPSFSLRIAEVYKLFYERNVGRASVLNVS